MSSTVEQAQALIAMLGEQSSEKPSIAVPSLAISLSSELIICGEWKLAFELCTAASSQFLTTAEQFEIDLNKVDCIIRFGELSEALGLLDAMLARKGDTRAIPGRLWHWAVILKAR